MAHAHLSPWRWTQQSLCCHRLQINQEQLRQPQQPEELRQCSPQPQYGGLARLGAQPHSHQCRLGELASGILHQEQRQLCKSERLWRRLSAQLQQLLSGERHERLPEILDSECRHRRLSLRLRVELRHTRQLLELSHSPHQGLCQKYLRQEQFLLPCRM